MNLRDVSLFLCLCTLFPIILVGLSIRTYFDNNDYILLAVSAGLALMLMFIAKELYNRSDRNKYDGDGGIKIRLT